MNGILPLYKPVGMTSADAVYHARKILHIKKSGIQARLIQVLMGCCHWRLVRQPKQSHN